MTNVEGEREHPEAEAEAEDTPAPQPAASLEDGAPEAGEAPVGEGVGVDAAEAGGPSAEEVAAAGEGPAPEAAAPSGEAQPREGAAPPHRQPRGDGPRERGDRGERRGRRPFGRRRVCAFCVEKVRVIDYKDAQRLRRYLSDRARIDPRRKTGTCAKHQRALTSALKRARHLALLPYTQEHIRLTGMFQSRR